jgi:hypothetical protein
VQDYAFTTSPPKLKLTIYRQEPGGTIVYWTGPVNNMSVDEDGRAAVRCPSFLGAALVGNIPDVHYQTPCNHTLYDGRCGVDYAANSNVTAVTAISADGKTITVGSIAALDGKLIGGELALGTGERRMIVSQVGTAITVNFPFARITVGGAATVAAGCDYAYSGDCKNKFDNQLRFGGFMFIPPINPFADGIEPAADGVADTSCVFTHPPPSGEWARVTLRLDEGPAHGGIAAILRNRRAFRRRVYPVDPVRAETKDRKRERRRSFPTSSSRARKKAIRFRAFTARSRRRASIRSGNATSKRFRLRRRLKPGCFRRRSKRSDTSI